MLQSCRSSKSATPANRPHEADEVSAGAASSRRPVGGAVADARPQACAARDRRRPASLMSRARAEATVSAVHPGPRAARSVEAAVQPQLSAGSADAGQGLRGQSSRCRASPTARCATCWSISTIALVSDLDSRAISIGRLCALPRSRLRARGDGSRSPGVLTAAHARRPQGDDATRPTGRMAPRDEMAAPRGRRRAAPADLQARARMLQIVGRSTVEIETVLAVLACGHRCRSPRCGRARVSAASSSRWRECCSFAGLDRYLEAR